MNVVMGLLRTWYQDLSDYRIPFVTGIGLEPCARTVAPRPQRGISSKPVSGHAAVNLNTPEYDPFCMQDQPDLKKRTVLLRLVGGFIGVAALLFLPAGTLLFWQGWLYLAVIFIPFIAVLAYLIRRDPELLVRRMQLKEKEPVEKPIITVASIFFLIGMIFPGLDFRFGWSHIPVVAVLASDVIVFAGYCIFFLTLRENSYASRIIEVMPGQKVITTGPYAVVRHPMYLGVILMTLFTPPALGSFWGVAIVIPVVAMILLRIRNEEELLLRELPGYREYCIRTPYRLVPGVW